MLVANLGLGRTYLDENRLDSALIFEKEAARIAETSGIRRSLSAVQSYTGAIYFAKNEPDLALQNLYYGISIGMETGNRAGIAQNYYRLTKYYLSQKKPDSSIYYALRFKEIMEKIRAVALSTVDKGMALEYLSLAYKLNNQNDSANFYQGLALTTKDSLNKARLHNLAEFQNLNLREQLRLRDLEKEQELYQGRVRSYALLAGLLVFSVIAFILYRNNKQKQETNRTLENTLSHLRSTQAQLIQSEKMASLGELTAGIAHEIQNPLNFVNNFSEINAELAEELNDAAEKGDLEEVKTLAIDIRSNEERIREHGKRADSIVKGMLQHSRTSSGAKEPTDINSLADEYLRLAYHGLCAKNKNFQSDYKFTPDPSLGKLNIVPQDIGRVLLNLINNAFYAVHEKSSTGIVNYEPMVELTTARSGDKVILTVKDNGNGIPESIRNKIFQPFFTTKPTGEGTGLGLSLSYDIIKAHGGEISVESQQGEGTVFTVSIRR
jgi:signal transduction histidine kinase